MVALHHPAPSGGKGWRDAALFAIVVQLIGGVNATSLVFVLVGTTLWLPFCVWVNREATWRRALGAYARIGLLTFVTSLWWMSGLWAQGRYGIDILRFTETAKTVASTSSATEVLRGLGYWFFYGSDKYGNFVQIGEPYTQHLWLIGTSLLLPALGLLGSGLGRFRDRAYFVALVVVGTILAVGAHPWGNPSVLGAIFRRLLQTSQAGGAMRSMPRAVPLLVLGLAVLLGSAVGALVGPLPERPEGARRGAPRPAGPGRRGRAAAARVRQLPAAVHRAADRQVPPAPPGHPQLLDAGHQGPRPAGQQHPGARDPRLRLRLLPLGHHRRPHHPGADEP